MSESAIKILICQGTGGVSMGAKEVEAEFLRVISEKGVNAIVGKRCDVIKTGCRGLCANDVLVDIISEEQGRVTYDFVKAEEVEKIVDEHIVNKTVLEKRKAKPYYNTFVDQQMRIVMTGCGQINPESLDAYLEEDGFKAIQQCVKEMNAASVIEEVKKSGLRGRGGGGFLRASSGHSAPHLPEN
jgi:NADH-quinone oxidoreductase subunit F